MTRGTTMERADQERESWNASSEDSRLLLMERVLASPDFVRSPQLAKFLLYICTAFFEGRGHLLSEQHIGVAVFGREPDYDSAADTIVRSHALRLRRRLEQYFQRAGESEPVHLIVPRGGYAPIFLSASERSTLVAASYPNEDAPQPTAESPSTPLPELSLEQPTEDPEVDLALPGTSKLATRRLFFYRIAVAVLALAFLSVSTAFYLHLRSHGLIRRNHLLWGRLFTDDQPTHIVLGDSGLVLFHAVARRTLSLHDYLNDDVSKQMPFVEHVEPDFARFLLHRRYTSTVDALALTHLLRLPEAIPERTLVHYSRDMHLNDFKTGNALLIGAQEAVPWVELFESHMDFVFSIENSDRHASFLNRHPAPGESAEYNPTAPETRGKVYAAIAFLPNLSATGNVLILEGLSMAGTESAVDLVMDDDRLLPLLKKIRKPDGSLPHFEMLLEAEALGESAGPARVIALHLHE